MRSNDQFRPLSEVGQRIAPADIDADTADEMARVGIVPSDEDDPIGYRFTMAGREFEVVAHATKADFLAAIKETGLNVAAFSAGVPDEFRFNHIREVKS